MISFSEAILKGNRERLLKYLDTHDIPNDNDNLTLLLLTLLESFCHDILKDDCEILFLMLIILL